MSKYAPLGGFLADTPLRITENTLAFRQIENILGFELPYSAYTHRAWWSNSLSRNIHPQTQIWLAAGWKVETVNQSEKWVRFERS